MGTAPWGGSNAPFLLEARVVPRLGVTWVDVSTSDEEVSDVDDMRARDEIASVTDGRVAGRPKSVFPRLSLVEVAGGKTIEKIEKGYSRSHSSASVLGLEWVNDMVSSARCMWGL